MRRVNSVLDDRGDFKMVLKNNCPKFPEWHHAVPESAYFKVPETLKTFRMYSTSRYAPCATRLNAKHSDSRIFLNEDLTGIRAKLAREESVLKKSGKIDDTWTFNGNVIIKDVAHNICLIRSAADIERFR